ncbi:hypothetical protein JOD63_000175 [Microbacterium terrae]|uniref:Uncharacterized protein n=1 Tax=Microbacterium terrae TaxID=69369 RepID=A0A0M2H3A8_9MICO|nr:hypothetical protein [Microbacterium terrae]KJL38788.1 hypothetical protein RS81_02583 [Microbacterium terrae]MBP1076207.1 hypothetical protein [Microbacterium terrae]GLJ97028.1 hypothetical protein GCM10017594_02250 [Microbacterium terrae]
MLFNGWFVIVAYLVIIAVVALALYAVVRLAVVHALKAHTKWVDSGKG